MYILTYVEIHSNSCKCCKCRLSANSGHRVGKSELGKKSEA